MHYFKQFLIRSHEMVLRINLNFQINYKFYSESQKWFNIEGKE
jgi:hypothetical protein